ncbi:ABC transporter ATP-binding protein [Cryptosporangium phraense]|uniref:ABC-type quaternary amine transporter n=1 Tax=Cryptosporangium phraense TaxID=2593070 RepID=A0A545AVK8_9ACTN|nr:ATP-binding cassette domain-containing protein [Cryptosporangium phraense]TQS45372.1 ATP-binding cassette domain-containing protein [Cryptosporangium phraense]
MITFENVTKQFPDGTVAVDNLSLEIPDGKITVLVGPSGCGKTTTLRMINRMIDSTSGTITIDGRNVRDMDPPTLRRGIGYVIQQAGLLPHRTILDNVATVPFLLGHDKKKARSDALALMERVGLPASFAKRYPHQLSGGQQQRVGVARALAADPPVMLMDEPFSAVDPVVRKSLQDEFLRLQKDLHKTIVMVTHDIDEAVKLGDLVCVLEVGGRIGQFDTPERLLASPSDGFVEEFLGDDRGVRRLSFVESDHLPLDPSRIVTTASAGDDWRLLVDADGKPSGWLEPGGSSDPLPVGRSFVVGRDSLRSALDSAVLNPSGEAIAVDGDGKAVGLAGQEQITSALRGRIPAGAAE